MWFIALKSHDQAKWHNTNKSILNLSPCIRKPNDFFISPTSHTFSVFFSSFFFRYDEANKDYDAILHDDPTNTVRRENGDREGKISLLKIFTVPYFVVSAFLKTLNMLRHFGLSSVSLLI